MAAIRIAMIGGDMRLAYMVPILAGKGCLLTCYGTEPIPEKSGVSYRFAGSLQEALEDADAVVCGIPFSKKGRVYSGGAIPDMEMSCFCAHLKRGQRLFGGVMPQTVKEECEKRQIVFYDFMEDEPLAVFNAVATAEGCILTALKKQPTNLHGSRAVVAGYGRCGRVLADKLKGLSVKVTVCARKPEQLACAEAAGMETLTFGSLPQEAGKYEYIFNTVPSTVITEEVLKKLSPSALVVDIASGSGGVDYEAAKKLGVRALLCPGLPGKYAPKASAAGMAEFVLRKMK